MIVRVLIMIICVTVNIKGKDSPSYDARSSDRFPNTSLTYKDKGDHRKCKRTDFHLIFLSFLLFFIPITIVGNSIVCIVVSCTRFLRKQPMYMYMASLALADVCVGVLSMPLKAKIEWDGGCFRLPWWVCWIFVLEEITFSVASTIHLFAIGIDRFLALQFAYKYKRMMSRRRYGSVIALIWSLSIFCALLSIFQWSDPSHVSVMPGKMGCSVKNKVYFTIMLPLFYVLPVFVLIFLYRHIYKIAVRHVNEIIKAEVHVSRTEMLSQRRKRHLKLLRSLIIVFLSYIVCWMPCIFFVLIIQHRKTDFYHRKEKWFRPVKFLFIDFLPHLNSTLNPFIYVLSNKEFKIAVRSLMKKIPVLKLKLQTSSQRCNVRCQEIELIEPKIENVHKFNKISRDSGTKTSTFY